MISSARVIVDGLDSAAELLSEVLTHARNQKDDFSFGPLNAEAVLRVGLKLDGSVEGLLSKIEKLQGVLVIEQS